MSTRHVPRLLLMLCLLSMAILLTACDNKVTQANFDQIQNGMSLSQVEKLLGKGTDDTPSAGYGVSGGGVMSTTAAPEEIYIWKTPDLTITVNFKDGKVVQKSKRE